MATNLKALGQYARKQGFKDADIARHKNDPRMHKLVHKAMRHDAGLSAASQQQQPAPAVASSLIQALQQQMPAAAPIAQSNQQRTIVHPPSGYSGGGSVSGPGTGTSDSIPANLSDGEFVLPADVVQAVGKGTLQKMLDSFHKPVSTERRPRN